MTLQVYLLERSLNERPCGSNRKQVEIEKIEIIMVLEKKKNKIFR